MEKILNLFGRHKKLSLCSLLMLTVLVVVTLRYTNLYAGMGAIVLFYFVIALAIYSWSEPRPGDVPLYFVLYIAVSLVFIMLFAFLSLFVSNDSSVFDGIGSLGGGVSGHLFFSATMFTSLGFSQYQPLNVDAQAFAIVQSLLGGAHSVTFMVIAVGRRFKATDVVNNLCKVPPQFDRINTKFTMLIWGVGGVLLLNIILLMVVLVK